jgi:nucleotide-binding universal stress UspA family protein
VQDRTTEGATVIVGIDGSPGSAVALRWAMDHADRLGRVVPVTTFLSGPFEHGFGPSPGFDGGGEPYRSEAVLQLTGFLEEHAPALVDDGVAIEHRAGPGLVEAAAGAELLVVGTRGWSSREDPSLGSVGSYCVRHAAVPVAVIPRDVPRIHDRLSVVVGVDGSARSVDALRWTLDHVRRDALVTAVRVTSAGPVIGDPLSSSAEEIEATARDELAACVAEVATRADGHPAVELSVLHGDPREVLGSAVAGTDLLVVGARGHGIIHRLMLGSVATALVHHPTLPTIVVPHDAR